MWWLISLVTFIIFIPLAVVEAFMAMIMANGYMGNTDPMVFSYLACQGSSLLALSLLSGLLSKWLKAHYALPLWVGGMAAIFLATVLQLGVSILAFFFAITFFAP